MKLFAKRKRSSTDHATLSETTRVQFQSDPVVEQLLTQDPSTWNSKQRRMIQRYQERKAQDQAHTPNTAVIETPTDGNESTETADEIKDSKPKRTLEKGSLDADKDTHHNSSDDHSDSDSSSSSSHSEDKNVQTTIVNVAETESSQQSAPVSTGTATDEAVSEYNASDDANMLKELLEKLNSKQRRKITRGMEHGEMTLAQALTEATTLLSSTTIVGQQTSLLVSKESKNSNEDKTTPSSGSNKRRKLVDDSKLTPEERMRREEQRRLQKEAAERRASEATLPSTHRHPLNSQRRRANRRKPKWNSHSQRKPVNEHDTSGYQMRSMSMKSN
jgi:hypothetical protein